MLIYCQAVLNIKYVFIFGAQQDAKACNTSQNQNREPLRIYLWYIKIQEVGRIYES